MPEKAGRPDPRRTTPPTTSGVDPERASPLGRGVDAGDVDTPGLAEAGVAGLHGHDLPGAKRGAGGNLTRANEDVEPAARE